MTRQLNTLADAWAVVSALAAIQKQAPINKIDFYTGARVALQLAVDNGLDPKVLLAETIAQFSIECARET